MCQQDGFRRQERRPVALAAVLLTGRVHDTQRLEELAPVCLRQRTNLPPYVLDSHRDVLAVEQLHVRRGGRILGDFPEYFDSALHCAHCRQLQLEAGAVVLLLPDGPDYFEVLRVDVHIHVVADELGDPHRVGTIRLHDQIPR